MAPLYTSSLSLVMITIERFLAVLFPFKLIFWMTPKIKALLIATAWSLPFILTFLLPILSWENEIKVGLMSYNRPITNPMMDHRML